MNDTPKQPSVADNAHAMQLTHTHENGDQEWLCPECGRHTIVRWTPEFQRTVLVTGDETAIHRGGMGGLAIAANVMERASEVDTALDDAWLDLIDGLDIDLP